MTTGLERKLEQQFDLRQLLHTYYSSHFVSTIIRLGYGKFFMWLPSSDWDNLMLDMKATFDQIFKYWLLDLKPSTIFFEN